MTPTAAPNPTIMPDPTILNIRFTVAALFVALGAVAVAVLAGVLWAVVRAMAEQPDAAAIIALVYGGVGFLLLAGIVATAWLLVHRRLVRPIAAITRGAETLARLDTDNAIELAKPHGLGALGDAVRGLAYKLHEMRGETNATVAAATARVEETKGRLEAILHDLSEGVVGCNLDHRVLLYNRAAMRILGAPGEIGLGRSLFDLVTREPVLHALERLTYRLAENRARDDEPTEPFVCSINDARALLDGRMGPIRDARGNMTGYVLTFADASHEIDAMVKRDGLLRNVTEGLRGPIANLRAAAETLAAHPDITSGERAVFDEVISTESTILSDRVDSLAAEYRALRGGHWPLSDVYSVDLLNCVIRHLGETDRIEVTMVGIPVWLHCDSHSLMLAVEHLIRRIHGATGATAFDLEMVAGDQRVYLDVIWRGPPIASKVLDSWADAPLADTLGGATLRDILDRHGSELWSHEQLPGHAVARIPLGAARHPRAVARRDPLPPRPEFYDFELVHQTGGPDARADRPLRESTYVVFDTETTGLHPSQGDEIVSIAGVRIVNGRILTGETFHRLVDPGRPIPKSSTAFHGIVDDMVRDKPPLRIVLPQFHKFVAGAVLVAHNAAFDMAFLKLKEAECGVAFDNPVLDMLLLSAVLHDHTQDHTLDAIATRFGIEVVDRHTALGDAMATAGIFVRMIELLESRNIGTLEQALEAANSMIEVRKMQSRF